MNLGGFEASMVYRTSSRRGSKATQKNPVSKNQKEKQTNPLQNSSYKIPKQAQEVVQWVKALVTEREDLSLIPGTHSVEGKN